MDAFQSLPWRPGERLAQLPNNNTYSSIAFSLTSTQSTMNVDAAFLVPVPWFGRRLWLVVKILLLVPDVMIVELASDPKCDAERADRPGQWR